jgi:hypothetical protein
MLLPPYLQNYARFLEPSLHPDPAPWLRFAHPDPAPWLRFTHPEPAPWAVPFLVSAVGAKEAAAGAANRDAVRPVVAAVDAAIDQFLDDYCGTPPRAVPGPAALGGRDRLGPDRRGAHLSGR